MRAQIVLRPAESKKLIAKAVLEMDTVKKALKEGIITIHPSSTTYHMFEYITGEKPEGVWLIGMICPRGTCLEGITQLEFERDKYDELGDPANFPFSWVFKKGTYISGSRLEDVLEEMGEGDIYVKGVNAIDSYGNIGVLIASLAGGTISKAALAQRRKGFQIIYVAGLEKFIPSSLKEVIKETGRDRTDAAFGIPCGLWVKKESCITEIDAFTSLTGVETIPIAAGGVGGAEGSVVFVLKGEDETVQKALELYKEMKGAQLPEIRLPDCLMCNFPGCNLAGKEIE
jgi:hypothetical protein